MNNAAVDNGDDEALSRCALVDGLSLKFDAYEATLPFPLRFMIDRDIVGGGWISIDEGCYRLRRNQERTSRCQIELDVFFEHVKGLPVDEVHTTFSAPSNTFGSDAALNSTWPWHHCASSPSISSVPHARTLSQSRNSIRSSKSPSRRLATLIPQPSLFDISGAAFAWAGAQ